MRGEREKFWDGLYARLDTAVKEARGKKRRVVGLFVIWRFVVLPMAVFVKSLVSGRVGRNTLREAVHKSVFSFAVSARLYELEKADLSELAKIKTRLNRPDSGA